MKDVIDAWNAIGEAEQRYRDILRAALADGVKQAEVAKAIDRTREMIRRDAMDETQREELRQRESDRLRRRREQQAALAAKRRK